MRSAGDTSTKPATTETTSVCAVKWTDNKKQHANTALDGHVYTTTNWKCRILDSRLQ